MNKNTRIGCGSEFCPMLLWIKTKKQDDREKIMPPETLRIDFTRGEMGTMKTIFPKTTILLERQT
jgi:hypothetical protein